MDVMFDHSHSQDWRREEVWMYTSLETGHSGCAADFSNKASLTALCHRQVTKILDRTGSYESRVGHVVPEMRCKELFSLITDEY